MDEQLPHSSLPAHSDLVASQSDPWMEIDIAAQWARRWTLAMAQRLTRAWHAGA